MQFWARRKTSKKCIFCTSDIHEINQSVEHIIPKSLHSSDKLTIMEVCKRCNNQLSTTIEQPAIKHLKKNLAVSITRGSSYRFGRRRKKTKKVPLDLGYTLVKGKEKMVGVPTSFYVDLEGKSMAMNLGFERLEREDQKAGMNSFLNSQKFAVVIPNVTEDEINNEIILLGQKIIYELCYLMWGRIFLRCPDASDLKKQLLEGKLQANRKLVLDVNEPLVYLEHENRKLKNELNGNQTESREMVSPFENFPHITFVVMKYPNNKWFALLNLFDYEITTNLFRLEEEVVDYLEEKGGIVLVIETLKGKRITLFPLEQYLKTKTG